MCLKVRGSVPVLWSQPSDWKLRPLVRTASLLALPHHARALKTHFLDLACSYLPLNEYGSCKSQQGPPRKSSSTFSIGSSEARNSTSSIHMVNLIDRKGTQGELGNLLSAAWEYMTYAKVPVLRRFGQYSLHPRTISAPQLSASLTESGDVTCKDGWEGGDLNEVVELSKQRKSLVLNRSEVPVQECLINITAHDVSAMYSNNIGSEDEDVKRSALGSSGSSGAGNVHSGASAMVKLQHIWFDYHHKCHDNAQAVAADLFPQLQRAVSTTEGVFTTRMTRSAPSAPLNSIYRHLQSESSDMTYIESKQQHLVRTNCMDCLDRTNVVQSVVSRWALTRQLASLAGSPHSGSNLTSRIRLNRTSVERNEGFLSAFVDEDKTLQLPDKVKLIVRFVIFLLSVIFEFCFVCFRKWRHSSGSCGLKTATI